MADIITITANWATGGLSSNMISRQYDNNRYRIQFMGYPEDSTEELIYYLLVWMRTDEAPSGAMLAPVRLDSDQWLISNYFTQKTQQIKFQLCIQNAGGTFEAHSPIFNGKILDSLDHDGEDIDIDTSALFDYYREYVNDLIIAAGAVVIDTDLDTSGAAADAKATGDAITELNGRLDQLDGGGLTADVKAALLACFNHVAWDSADPTGQSYISALQTALYPPANLSSISAVYTQSGTVWTTDTLDSLKTNLVVTAHYSDSTSEVLAGSAYTLSGTLTEGTRTITVGYGGKTATFTVVVTQKQKNTVAWVGGGTSSSHTVTNNDGTYILGYTEKDTPSADYYQAWATDCVQGEKLYLNFDNDNMVSCGVMLYIVGSESNILQSNKTVSASGGDLDENNIWITSGFGKLALTLSDDGYVTIPATGKLVIMIRGNAYKPDSETTGSTGTLYTALNNGVFDFYLE